MELRVLLVLLCCVVVVVYAQTPSLKVLAIGDFGGQPSSPYTTQIQLSTASALLAQAKSVQPQFFLALGDNFYDKGVRNANDPRFQQTFEKVYSDPAFQKKWYVIAGNHDHYQNVTGEVAYSKFSSRWVFPSLYYTMVVPVANFTVQFVFIDTIVLAGLWEEGYAQPFGPRDEKLAADEWQWIENTLATSKADWLFVVGHYPVYSTGEHGSTSILVQKLEPLLEKYQVAAYIDGHDHGLQHLSPKVVNYFVIGNGAKCEYQNQHSAPGSKFRYPLPSDTEASCSTGGFGSLEVTKLQSTVKLFNSKSLVVYEYSFKNPRQASPN